jgi:hypothetical protein
MGLLIGIGQEIGQMLGPDDGDAACRAGRRNLMAFPADAGMDVQEIDGGPGQPVPEIAGLVDELDPQPVAGSARQEAGSILRRHGKRDIPAVDKSAAKGKHMLAHAGWVQTICRQDDTRFVSHAGHRL